MLLVCLNSASAPQEAVRRSGRFAVNILAEHQGHIAERFARPGSTTSSPDRGAGRDTPECPARRRAGCGRCPVVEVVAGGTRPRLPRRAVHAEATESAPLAYFRGKLREAELGQDAEVYRLVRRMVLRRELGPDEPEEVESFAARLSVPPSSSVLRAHPARGEKLVGTRPAARPRRHPARHGHLDDAHDAKLAIELGAAELADRSAVRRPAGPASELAQAADATVQGGRFGTSTATSAPTTPSTASSWTRPVSAALVDAYEQLSVSDLMARALPADMDADPHCGPTTRPDRRAGAQGPGRGPTGDDGAQRAGEGDQREGILRAGGRLQVARLAQSAAAPTGRPSSPAALFQRIGPRRRRIEPEPQDGLDR